jgi:hypothetical protein
MGQQQQRWTAEQCAAHAGITTSTWRDYVADDRAPTALPGYDPDTGRKTWDPTTVRTWQAHRPGQGTRTDLTYLPGTDGQPVFISATTITTATLLHDLASPHRTTIPRTTLKQRWTQQFPHDNHTPPLHPPTTPQTPQPQDKSPQHSTPCTNSVQSTTTVTTSPSPTTPTSPESQPVTPIQYTAITTQKIR